MVLSFISLPYTDVSSAQLKVRSNMFTVCIACPFHLCHVLCVQASYPDSRQVTSCPGTGTPCCGGTGSQPGAGCCSARGAEEASAKENNNIINEILKHS